MIQPEIQDLETIQSLRSTLLPSPSHENRLNFNNIYKTKMCQSLYKLAIYNKILIYCNRRGRTYYYYSKDRTLKTLIEDGYTLRTHVLDTLLGRKCDK